MMRVRRLLTGCLLLLLAWIATPAHAAPPSDEELAEMLAPVALGEPLDGDVHWRIGEGSGDTRRLELVTDEGREVARLEFDDRRDAGQVRRAGAWWVRGLSASRPGWDDGGELERRRFAHVTAAYASMARVPLRDVVPAPPWWTRAGATAGFVGGLFAVWLGLLGVGHLRGRTLEIASGVRLNHVLPAALQVVLYLYWAAWVAPVRDRFTFILAQLAYAYVLEAALSWTLRRRWEVTLGMFPIVFASNLFVWFLPPHPGQLFPPAAISIGAAIASRHFVRRGGRHVVNPAAFGIGTLAVIEAVGRGLGTGWLQHDVPTTGVWLNLPPNMTLIVLLVGLVAASNFSIILVSIGGLVGLNSTLTGGSTVPTWPSTFLVLVLFATDPTTTPRTNPGRLLFGLSLSVAIFVLAQGYRVFGLGDDFSKVLAVVVCNVLAPWFDRAGVWLDQGWRRLADTGPVGVVVFAAAALWWLRAVLEGPQLPILLVCVALAWWSLSERPGFADLWTPAANRVHLALWIVLVWSFHHQHKPWMFERFLHVHQDTPGIVVGADGVPDCDDNPAWCVPFDVVAEVPLWFGRGATSDRVARSPGAGP